MPVYFGEKIRAARKARGLTQRQLAGLLSVTNTSISNWETGVSRPNADAIQALCGILGLEPNDFYSSEPDQAPESVRCPISDQELKFALFGGGGDITDAMFDEVKRFAAFLKQREAEK